MTNAPCSEVVRPRWARTGTLSGCPDVSVDEAKAQDSQGPSELRSRPDTSPLSLDMGFLTVYNHKPSSIKTIALLIESLKPERARVFSGSSVASCGFVLRLVSHWRTRSSSSASYSL